MAGEKKTGINTIDFAGVTITLPNLIAQQFHQLWLQNMDLSAQELLHNLIISQSEKENKLAKNIHSILDPQYEIFRQERLKEHREMATKVNAENAVFINEYAALCAKHKKKIDCPYEELEVVSCEDENLELQIIDNFIIKEL